MANQTNYTLDFVLSDGQLLARLVRLTKQKLAIILDYITHSGSKEQKQIAEAEDHSELSALLKQFWDLETIRITASDPQMTPQEKLAWSKVSKSLKFDGGHYQVAVPWREGCPSLPNNLALAKRRLVSTERKLFKEKEVATAYQQVLDDYLDKQYIRRVPSEKQRPECEWFLPHFPVVCPNKSTMKVRIIFDGSAPFEGKSLNTEALTGLKLQSDVFDILVKFRKEQVALVGDKPNVPSVNPTALRLAATPIPVA